MGIQVKSVKVRALKDFTYGTGLKTVGQEFDAKQDHAEKMVSNGRAEYVAKPKLKSNVLSD